MDNKNNTKIQGSTQTPSVSKPSNTAQQGEPTKTAGSITWTGFCRTCGSQVNSKELKSIDAANKICDKCVNRKE